MEPTPQNESASSPAATNQLQQSVPASWPSAFGAYKYSKEAVKQNVGTIVILFVLNIILSGALQEVLKASGGLIAFLADSLIVAALTLAYIASVRRQRLSISQAFSQAFPLWLKMIGLTLLTILSYAISLLLLIIPFFFVLPRLILAPYFLVDKKMGVMEAYKASWAASKGHATQIWGIVGVSILMGVLMITIIGIPFAIYFLIMYSAVFAVLYEFVGKQPVAASAGQPATPAVPAQPPIAPAPPAV